MSRAPSWCGVILAAGESSRMGSDKALLPWPPVANRAPFSSETFLSAAVMITLVDRPPVSAAVLAGLRTAFEAAASEVWAVVPEYDGRHGHPFLAGREMIEAFLKAPVTATAREVEHQHQQHLLYVPVGDPHVAMNVNTPQDYAALLNPQAS